MARYSAFLDACVLVPIALADTLLRLAEAGLYRPLWSDRVLDEATATRRPAITTKALLDHLARCGVPAFASAAAGQLWRDD